MAGVQSDKMIALGRTILLKYCFITDYKNKHFSIPVTFLWQPCLLVIVSLNYMIKTLCLKKQLVNTVVVILNTHSRKETKDHQAD